MRHVARWVALVVLAGGLAAPPAREPVAGAAEGAAEPVRALPLTEVDRAPVPVGEPLDGIVDPKVAPPALPGPAASPLAALGAALPVPEAGGPQQDAFSPGEGVGDHFALLSADVFNVQDPEGRWVDAALVPDDYGWSLATPAFTVRFPKVLASDTPVVYETAGGRIDTVPAGVAPVPGEASGTTVTYAGALPGTDLRYEVTAAGLKEHVVLRKGASGELAWDVRAEGLALAADPTGGLALSAAGKPVGWVPPALVVDAASPPRALQPAYGLQDLGGGSYRISLSVPASYLGKATFPVTVDPGYQTTVAPQADTYAYSGAAGRNYGSATTMQTGPSTKYRAFIKFPTTWQRDGRLIYSAELHVFNDTEANDGQAATARRITAGWTEGGLTWSNQPGVSDVPNPRSANGPAGGEFVFELKNLYQRYNDGEFADHGVRLESPDKKVFSTKESATASRRPYLLVTYNDPPNTPNLNTPADGRAFEDTSGISLRLDRIPADLNGDEVLVRYQVTPVQGDWQAGWSSPWTDEEAFEVPAEWLTDGGTYFWRVQAADVCAQPDTLCPMEDGTGQARPYPASPVRSFTVLRRNWGLDERYATWSRQLGNGMTLSVNEANGNLVLQVPIEAVRTPLGWLRIGLSYNSQAAAADKDQGLGPGWRLWAGPGSSGQKLPTEIEELAPAPYAGVKVHLRGGGAEFYPWRGGGAYGTVGSGSGVVRKAANGTFSYRTADGDLYTFDAQGELLRAKPVTTKPRAAGTAAAYRYGFDAAGHLTSLTDPLGREITFTWSGSPARLTRVDVLGHVVRLAYGAEGPTQITTPAGETIRLSYADTCNGRNLLSEVRDGEQAARGLPGWRIEHFYDTGPANSDWRVCRARKLFPPQPAGGTERWAFTYGTAGYKGTTSLTTLVTDPRGVASATEGDYTTVVDFNYSGLPIRIVAPKDDPATDPDEITTMVWDAEGNLLCSRSPQANALDQTQCSGADQRDRFNAEYDYDTTVRPFRLTARTDPAPEAGAARLQRTYVYDAGPNFTGLWAELYENRNLAGVPDDERRFTDLAQDWGTGHPAGVSVDDDFSIRLSGYLVIPGNQARTYRFRVGSDDGVTLVVGKRVLLNCLGQDFSGTNCGQAEDPKAKLSPGLRPIVLEYQERTGSARLSLRWDQGTGEWQVIPEASLIPNLGLLTSVWTGPDTGTNNLATEITYAYAGDEAKARRLVTARTRRDLDPDYAGPDEVRTTTFTYDDYGRRTEIVRFAGTAEEARTLRTFTDDPQTGSCLTRVEDPTGAVVEYACDAWGDVTEERVVIREVRAADGTMLQTAEVRKTTWTYDEVGRVIELDPAGPGLLRYGYDRAGRVVREEELVEGTSTFAVTSYAYDDHATPPTMTETLPDPDRGGPLSAPVVIHTYDRVGNEVSRTDPRDPSWTWETDYDAQDRVVATRSPDGLQTTTAYSVRPYTVTVTDPAEIATVTELDQLGRVVREQVGNLAPTTYTYDLRGNLKREEVSRAGTVYTWAVHIHNAFGNVVEDRAPYYDGTSVSTAVTSYAYDAAGRLVEVQGPRPENDKLAYDYDRAGRLVSATYWTSASESYAATYTYNDAGELLQEKMARGSGLTPARRRLTYTKAGLPETVTVVRPGGDLVTTNTYTPAGWLRTSTDPRGCTVTHTYDDLGREVATDGGACGGRLTFSYLADGSLEEARDEGSGAVRSMAYDLAGRLLRVCASPAPCSGQAETTYAYDTVGRLEKVTTPAGTTSYTYYGAGDAKGLLKTVDDPLTASGVTTYVYDPAGRIQSRTDAQAGVSWVRTYEPETGRLAEQTATAASGAPLARFALTYDEAGHVRTRTVQLGAAGSDPRNGTWTYTYDDAGRLTRAVGPDPTDPAGTVRTFTYGYDGAGNLASVGVDGNLSTYALDARGLPTSLDPGTPADPSDDTAFTYDGAGLLTAVDAPGTAGDRTFTYDGLGRLSAATVGGTGVAYAYDALGRLLTRTEGTTTETFAYEGTGHALTRRVRGGETTLYASTPAGPLAERSGGTVLFYLLDPHGDTIGTVQAGGTTPSSRAYGTPWGELTWSGPAPVLGFQSQLTDPVTGAVATPARWYLPSLARFASPDPLPGDMQLPLSLNRYAYALDDPASLSDPSGLRPVCGEGCTPDEEAGLVRAWAGAQAEAAASGTGAYDPGRVGEPAPPWAARVAGWVGDLLGAWEPVAEQAEEVSRTASLAGRLLRTGTEAERSWAGRTLPRTGGSVLDDLARSRWGSALVRGGRILGPIGAGLTFVGDYAETLSDPRNTPAEALVHATFVTGGSALGGWVGGLAGAALCGAGAPLCALLWVVGGTVVGQVAGDRVGDSFIQDRAMCAAPVFVTGAAGRGFGYVRCGG